MAFGEFGGPCDYVVSGKVERVWQCDESQILEIEHTNLSRLKSVH